MRPAGWEFARVIPLSPGSAPVQGKILAAGDAAGQVKATTGGGIVMGGIGGREAGVAARAYLELGAPLSEYRHAYEPYLKDLAVHYRLRRIYNSMNNEQIESLMRRLKQAGVEDILSQYGDMDRARVSLLSLWRMDKRSLLPLLPLLAQALWD